MANSPKLTLLTLPRELRDQIYAQTFTNDIVSFEHVLGLPKPRIPGILGAYKQTYNEASGSYYQHAIFLFQYRALAIYWIERVPISMLQKVMQLHIDNEMKLDRDQGGNLFIANKHYRTYARVVVDKLRERVPDVAQGVLMFKGRLPNEGIVWVDESALKLNEI